MLGLRLLQISRAIDRRSAVVADVVDVAADETLYLFIYLYLFFRRRPGFASCNARSSRARTSGRPQPQRGPP